MTTCMYPGSFDPFTNGHLDVLARASVIFDKVIVAVIDNIAKRFVFSQEERMDFVRKAAQEAGITNVEVATFDGLVVEFARQQSAVALIRGLRVISDFEYEMQMAAMNKKLAPEIETIFVMTNTKYSYLSSSRVREIGKYGADLREFVPGVNLDFIAKRLANQ